MRNLSINSAKQFELRSYKYLYIHCISQANLKRFKDADNMLIEKYSTETLIKLQKV